MPARTKKEHWIVGYRMHIAVGIITLTMLIISILSMLIFDLAGRTYLIFQIIAGLSGLATLIMSWLVVWKLYKVTQKGKKK